MSHDFSSGDGFGRGEEHDLDAERGGGDVRWQHGERHGPAYARELGPGPAHGGGTDRGGECGRGRFASAAPLSGQAGPGAAAGPERPRGGGAVRRARAPWPTRTVPDLTPVRVGCGGRHRLRRFVHRRRRMAAAGLALAATAMAVAAARTQQSADGAHPRADARTDVPRSSTSAAGTADGRSADGTGGKRSAKVPVRINDAASVRLLHEGDRVDVFAGTDGSVKARVVARSARVAEVPEGSDTVPGDGALIVLSVPREKAAALAGAAAGSRLAVALC